MRKIAVTGGIGSGKSVVCRFLEVLSFPVYNADARAKELMCSSPEIKKGLIHLLGNQIYEDGRLNRSLVAQRMFGDVAILKQINALVHPVVKVDFVEWCNMQQGRFVFMESAILYESGFEDSVDTVWVVTAPKHKRIERVRNRDSVSEQQVLSRMRVQWTDEEKCRLAGNQIINDDKRPLIPQVFSLLEKYK